MTEQDLRYDQMVENALRGVVRQALGLAADKGLPGNHHFYITFRTDHPGSVLADHLQERYPGEMTIVLQHQFWGLQIHDEDFEVTLSFDDKPERLRIPFAAVVAFADPSVRFGLQFEAGDQDGDDAKAGKAGGEVSDPPSIEGMVDRTQGNALTPAQPQPGTARADKKAEQDSEEKAGDSGEVVSLDAFRKK